MLAEVIEEDSVDGWTQMWRYGVLGFLCGSCALIVVFQCACCKKKPKEQYPISLTWRMDDAAVPPPEWKEDEENEVGMDQVKKESTKSTKMETVDQKSPKVTIQGGYIWLAKNEKKGKLAEPPYETVDARLAVPHPKSVGSEKNQLNPKSSETEESRTAVTFRLSTSEKLHPKPKPNLTSKSNGSKWRGGWFGRDDRRFVTLDKTNGDKHRYETIGDLDGDRKREMADLTADPHYLTMKDVTSFRPTVLAKPAVKKSVLVTPVEKQANAMDRMNQSENDEGRSVSCGGQSRTMVSPTGVSKSLTIVADH